MINTEFFGVVTKMGCFETHSVFYVTISYILYIFVTNIYKVVYYNDLRCNKSVTKGVTICNKNQNCYIKKNLNN